MAIAQGKLVESVVEQARSLNLKSRLSTLVLIGLFALVLFFLICSLMMWAGYRIGTGGSQMPELMFRMPSGLMIGLLLLGCAGIFSYLAAKEYADEKNFVATPCWRGHFNHFGRFGLHGQPVSPNFPEAEVPDNCKKIFQLYQKPQLLGQPPDAIPNIDFSNCS